MESILVCFIKQFFSKKSTHHELAFCKFSKYIELLLVQFKPRYKKTQEKGAQQQKSKLHQIFLILDNYLNLKFSNT